MAVKKKSDKLSKLEKLRQRLSEVDTGGGRGFWSPKEGRSVIRILPEVHEMEFFFQTVGRHNLPPAGKEWVYCPEFTSEGELPCPICDLIKDLYRAGDKGSKMLAEELGLRKMYWMNVINREDESSGPMIYTPGVTVFDQVCSFIHDPEYGDVTDIDEGFDIIIERSGTGLSTKYQVKAKRMTSPLADDDKTIDKWLEDARDLSYVEVSEDPEEDDAMRGNHAVYVLPYDRIVSESLGDFDEMFEEEDEEYDEDEEEYIDEDEEEEEEETPARKEVKRRMTRRSSRRRR